MSKDLVKCPTRHFKDNLFVPFLQKSCSGEWLTNPVTEGTVPSQNRLTDNCVCVRGGYTVSSHHLAKTLTDQSMSSFQEINDDYQWISLLNWSIWDSCGRTNKEVGRTEECLPLTNVHGSMLGLFENIPLSPPENGIMFSYLLRSKGLWWHLNTLLGHIQVSVTWVPTSGFQAPYPFPGSASSLPLRFLSTPQQFLWDLNMSSFTHESQNSNQVTVWW